MKTKKVIAMALMLGLAYSLSVGAVSAEAERGRGKLPEGYRRRKLGAGGRRLKERRLS